MCHEFGILLDGSSDLLKQSYEEFCKIPVDLDLSDEKPDLLQKTQKTIAKTVEVCAPGTFSKGNIRKLRLEPYDTGGWWFNREDQPNSKPIKVCTRNVWTTEDIVNTIVLRSGSSHNYIRLVEHIIALKAGMDIDSLMIHIDAGDPPLFEKGSLELVKALRNAGTKELKDKKARYFTVKEKVSIVTPHGGFLIISPQEKDDYSLNIDCARHFPNAIGKQRIKFPLNTKNFNMGAEARTNTTSRQKLFCKTIGLIFANIRNLGYNNKNVLVAGKKKYMNEPRLLHKGKSLEAVWHRAILDLIAAFALIEHGRLLANVIDYKGGHYMDVEMVKLLYNHDLLKEIQF